MFMVPKEIYSRVISNLNSDQKRRVDEINVDQVNVACGPLFAGLKKGKKSKVVKEASKNLISGGEFSNDTEMHENEDLSHNGISSNSVDAMKPKIKTVKGRSQQKNKSNNRKNEPLKKLTAKTKKVVKIKESSAIKKNGSKVKKGKSPTKNIRREKVVGDIALVNKSAHARSGRPTATTSNNGQPSASFGFTSTKNSAISNGKSARKKAIKRQSAIQNAFNSPSKPISEQKHDSAENVIWDSILSPSEKKDKDEREKNVRNRWGGQRVFGLSEIHPIRERSDKKVKKGRDPLNSTAVGAQNGVNSTATISDSIFDRDTILAPTNKSAETTVNEVIAPSIQSDKPYGNIVKLFTDDLRNIPKESAEETINRDILNHLIVPENAQETLEINRSLGLSTPKSVRKISEHFSPLASSPSGGDETLEEEENLPTKATYPKHSEKPFGRSSMLGRSPPRGTSSTFYGGKQKSPMKAGSLSQQDNVTTRLTKSALAKKERDRKRALGILVTSPAKGKKSAKT